MTDITHIRHALGNFGKTDLRDVAAKVGCTREALTDWAENSLLAPPADVLAKLQAWWEVYSLRRALNNPENGPITLGIAEACGISKPDYGDFLAGLTDLSDELRAKLRAAFGNGGKQLPKPATMQLHHSSLPLSAMIAKRGKAHAFIRSMESDELDAFIADREAARIAKGAPEPDEIERIPSLKTVRDAAAA